MKRIRIYIVAAAVAALGLLPVSPASANHRCGLGDNPVNSICEGAHDIPQIILCTVVPKLCA